MTTNIKVTDGMLKSAYSLLFLLFATIGVAILTPDMKHYFGWESIALGIYFLSLALHQRSTTL